MSKNLGAWSMLLFLGCFAALTFWLDRAVQPASPKLDGSGRHDADFIVDRFTAVQRYPSGEPQYTLAAERMTHYPDDETTHLQQPRLARFAPGSAPIRVEARRGLLSRDGEEAYLHDDVRLTREAYGNVSALTLQTSYLRVRPKDGVASTDQPVLIRDARTQINAVGLEWDGNKRILKLKSRVKVRYEPPRG